MGPHRSEIFHFWRRNPIGWHFLVGNNETWWLRIVHVHGRWRIFHDDWRDFFHGGLGWGYEKNRWPTFFLRYIEFERSKCAAQTWRNLCSVFGGMCDRNQPVGVSRRNDHSYNQGIHPTGMCFSSSFVNENHLQFCSNPWKWIVRERERKKYETGGLIERILREIFTRPGETCLHLPLCQQTLRRAEWKSSTTRGRVPVSVVSRRVQKHTLQFLPMRP